MECINILGRDNWRQAALFFASNNETMKGSNMLFAAILAGGKGSRMGNQDKPKQYLLLNNKPIIVYTVEKFLAFSEIEKILVMCPETWVEPTKDILKTHFGNNERLCVLPGGAMRNDTIMNSINYLEANYDLDDQAALITHDSVRPFVTYRIIEENIKAMNEYDACDTVIPCTDTIVESVDSSIISNVPDRSHLYQGQTPQTFKIHKMISAFASLTEAEKAMLTDACKIFTIKGEPVKLIKGEPFNIKITYPSDLKIAHALLGME